MRTNVITIKNKIAVSDSLLFLALGFALGITFPQLFHHLGLGSTFLPLFLPIVLLSPFLPLGYLTIIAISLPLANSFIFGMPPLPIAFILIGELNILTLFMTYLLKKLSFYGSLVFSLILERTLMFCLAFFHILPGISTDSIFASYPGVIMNIVLGGIFWKITLSCDVKDSDQ